MRLFSFPSSKWQNCCTFNQTISRRSSLFSRCRAQRRVQPPRGLDWLGEWDPRGRREDGEEGRSGMKWWGVGVRGERSVLQVLRYLLRMEKYYALRNTVRLLIKKSSRVPDRTRGPLYIPSPLPYFGSNQQKCLWAWVRKGSVLFAIYIFDCCRMTTSSPTLQQLISSDDLLRQFFRMNPTQSHSDLALQLMRQAISARMQASPSKHHHVAYIKHNRFLSPSQKQEVTPKVTQMIPVNDQPNKIYAKPKPRNEQQPQNPAKSQQEIETRQEIPSKEALPSPKAYRSQKEVQNQEEQEKREQSEKYLSPKTHHNPPKVPNQTKPNKQFVSPPTKHAPYYSPKAVSSSNGLKLQSNYHSGMGSPKPLKEDYGRVESRIKFLIDRDKQSKKMERALQAQSEKIEKLEERQERLLLLQYEQERELLRTQKDTNPRKHPKALDSDSDSSSGNNGLSRISSRLQAIEQRADGVREYQSRLYANLQKMRDKTYKISSHPVYPITSSEEDQEEDSL